MKAGFAATGRARKAGLMRPANPNATTNASATMALTFCLFTSLLDSLKHVSDGACKSVSSVINVRQRADAEERIADARRHARHGPEGVIEEVIKFEDDRRRRRDVQAKSRARAVQVEIRECSIQSYHFVTHDGRDVTALVEML